MGSDYVLLKFDGEGMRVYCREKVTCDRESSKVQLAVGSRIKGGS